MTLGGGGGVWGFFRNFRERDFYDEGNILSGGSRLCLVTSDSRRVKRWEIFFSLASMHG